MEVGGQAAYFSALFHKHLKCFIPNNCGCWSNSAIFNNLSFKHSKNEPCQSPVSGENSSTTGASEERAELNMQHLSSVILFRGCQ